MKIVLDTNVLIAAFITRGMSRVVFEHCIQQHTLVTSEFILNELEEKLLGKFKYSVFEVDETIGMLRSQMTLVEPLTVGQSDIRDPDDIQVLGTALAGAADCIITGDKDLLVLNPYQTVDILQPSGFAAYESLFR